MLLTFRAVIRLFPSAVFEITSASSFSNFFKVLAMLFCYLDTHQSYALEQEKKIECRENRKKN